MVVRKGKQTVSYPILSALIFGVENVLLSRRHQEVRVGGVGVKILPEFGALRNDDHDAGAVYSGLFRPGSRPRRRLRRCLELVLSVWVLLFIAKI